MTSKVVEVNEAIEAGNDLLNKIDSTLNSLNSAKLWGVFDMFSDHSLLSGILKHSKLDDAQATMNELKYSLKKFNDELKDVKVYDNVNQINFDEFVKIFDIFFDNFFVDLYAFSKISESKRQVEQLKNEVKRVLNQLQGINY